EADVDNGDVASPTDATTPEFDDPAAEVERLQGRQMEIEASLLALDTVDPYPVQSALAQLESGDDEGDLVASNDAIRMADELARIDLAIGDDLPVDSGGSAISVARRRLEAARAELAAAEDTVRELEAGVDAELARAAMVARRRELVSAAIALLGRDPGPDLEWALRQHRVRVKDSSDRSGRLSEALEKAGMA